MYLSYPKFKAFDFNGEPLEGGLLNVYEAGTVTRKNTYSDSGLTTANSNPVVLDANGEAVVYFNNIAKFVLTDKDGGSTPFGTMDNVPSTQAEAYKYYVDANEANQGVAGDGRSVKDILTLEPTNPATIVFTHSEQDAKTEYVFSTTTAITSNFNVEIENGARLEDDGSNASLSIAGTMSEYNYQVFDWGNGSGAVTFSSLAQWVTPQMWGAVGDSDGSTGNGTDDYAEMAAAIASTANVRWPGTRSYRQTGNLTLSSQRIYDFEDSQLVYEGSGTGVTINGGPVIKGMLNVARTPDYSGAGIGVEINNLNRKNPKIRTTGFLTGTKLNATNGNSIGYNDFWIEAYNCKTGLHITEAGTGWVNANNFYGLTAGADAQTTSGSYGVYVDCATYGHGLTFYGPTIETVETAMFFNAAGRGTTIIGYYIESVDDIIVATSDVDNLTIVGTFNTSPTGPVVDLTPTNHSITSIDKENILLIDPYNANSSLHYYRGSYVGKDQTFNNLLTNGAFEYWDSQTPTALGWSDTDITRESSTVKIGTYSLHHTPSGATARILQTVALDSGPYANQIQGENVTVMGWVRSAGTEGSSSITIETNGTGGVRVGASNTDGETAAINTWERVFKVVSVPSDATWIKVGLQVTTTNNGYFDGITLTVGKNVPRYEAYSLTENDIFPQIKTIPALLNQSTPSVAGLPSCRSGGTTGITDFDNGVEGQIIYFIAEHAVTISDGANIILNGSGNFAMQPTDTLTLICKADNNWYELARSDNT